MQREDLIPKGTYTAVAARVPDEEGNAPLVRFGIAGEQNTRQVLMYFEIIEGDHAGEVYPWFGFFSKKAHKRTIESLRFCGFKGNDLMAINDQDLAQKVQIVIGHQESTKTNEETGETKTNWYARVDWVNRLGAGAIKLKNPMSQDDVRKFAAMMRRHCEEVPEVEGEVVKSNDGASTANRSDAYGDDPGPASQFDDIPF